MTSYDLSSIESTIAQAIGGTNFEASMLHEVSIWHEMIKMRNVGECVYDSPSNVGMLFSKTSNFINNEKKFNDLWVTMYRYHVRDVNIDMLNGHRAWAKTVIQRLALDPMWYDITNEEALSSEVPKFRIASSEYYNTRIATSIKNANNTKYERPLQAYEAIGENDKIMPLVDDLRPDGITKVKLSNYLRSRVMDNDPFYSSHPIEYLLLTVLYIKAVSPGYINPVVVYFNELLEHINNDARWQYHVPVEFGSDGKLISVSYHSHIILHFKVMMNSLSLLLTNYDIHNFSPEYISISNELLKYLISNDVVGSGRKLKSMFNMVNLYYGMDVSNYNLEDDVHLHPRYPTFVPPTRARPTSTATFEASHDCHGCSISDYARCAYTKNLRTEIAKSIHEIEKEGLLQFSNFIKNNLLKCKINMSILHDVIFVRIHLNVGGYSHTHQLTDFDKQIRTSIAENQEFMKKAESCNNKIWILDSMYEFGQNITTMCINNYLYPTASAFKKELFKYTTSRSSGVMPFQVNFEFKDPSLNRKKTLTAKNANFMITGDSALNVGRYNMNYIDRDDFKNHLTQDEYDAWLDNRLPTHYILQKRSISRIGSRATVAFRPTRPIYINSITMHFAQAAILGPHVEFSNLHLRSAPNSMYPSELDMGNGISTMFQDGTLNVVSQAVMASSQGNLFSVCADASTWDQHFINPMIDAYLNGISDVISRDEKFKHEYYLYNNDAGYTIPDIIEWLKKAHDNKAYLASYLNSSILYRVGFMTSGSLYTFYLNSILNVAINRQIARRLSSYGCDYVYILEAGDDSLALMKAPSRFGGDKIEGVKQLIADVYGEANQKVNINKTSLSINSGEFAKMYWYWGFTFRDPSMQWFESEKTSRSESYIEKIRGYGQKLFEASKRSLGNGKLNASYARALLVMSYHMNTRVRESNSDKSVMLKYYPPFSSVITPTSYNGGLGYTVSGVSMNEISIIINHLLKFVNDGLPIVDAINFDVDRAIINGIFKHYFPDKENILNDITKDNKSAMLNSATFTSDDPLLNSGSFKRGLEFQVSQLTAPKITSSNNAGCTLVARQIKLPIKYKYDNMPYFNFYNTIDVMSVDKSAVTRSLEYNISKIFVIKHGAVEVSRNLLKRSMDIKDKYPLYASFDIILKERSSLVHKQEHVRYVSAPDISYELERRYGSVYGRHHGSSLRGSNMALLRFIKQNGLSITESMLMDIIIESGVLASSAHQDNLMLLMVYIGGDEHSAAKLAAALMSEKITLEGEMLSTHIRGTVLENIDMSNSTIARYVTNFIAIQPPLSNVVRTIAFIYSIQYSAFTGANQCDAVINVNPRYRELISSIMARKTVGKVEQLLRQLAYDYSYGKKKYVNFMTDDRMLL